MKPVTKQPEMLWRADLNGGYWICNAEIALREWELERIRQYMIGRQAKNRLGLPPGDVRDDLDASVKALHAKRIATNVTGGGGRWWSSYGDSKWDKKPKEVQITVKKKKKPHVIEVSLPDFNDERSLKSLEQIREAMAANRRAEKLIQDALDDEEAITLIFKCL